MVGRKGKYFNIHSEGNYLHSNEININEDLNEFLDTQLEENNSIERKIFNACENQLKRVLNKNKRN